MDLLKLLLVLVAIVIALRQRVAVGLTLVGAAGLTLLLFQTPVDDISAAMANLVISQTFVSLTAVVVLITLLGSLLSELGFLTTLTESCRGLAGGSRTAAAVLPALIGLMPMPAGSLLSAPLVDNVLPESRYTPEFKTAVNYWYRHWVELFWPLYPGLILTEAITGMPIGSVSLLQLPVGLLMAVVGFFFFLRRIEFRQSGSPATLVSIAGIIRSIWPVLLAIVIYATFRIELSLAILGAVIILIIVRRPDKMVLYHSVVTGFSWKLILLIFGVLSFQRALEISGSIDSVTRLATSSGLPIEAIIFAVCFTVGLLTGVVAAYVGLGYSLLAGLLYQPEIRPDLILVAYLSGYLGVMLSPSHLCLILTNQFFGGNLVAVYRKIAPAFLVVTVLGFLIYLSGWPQIFR